MILEVKNLNVYIKASHILRNVAIEVGEGEVVCLIGRNGAGKTTLLRTIMGFLKPEAGSIEFKREEIKGLAPHEIAMRGMGFAPEESEIFADLTTFENIEIATWTRQTSRAPEERIKLA
jgi:branched-chain amino acid transport system ATP-binding protein